MLSNLKSEKENQEYLKSIIGANRNNRIDWKNSVGYEIEYEYDWNRGGEYSKGVLRIAKYEPKNHKVYFEGYEKGIVTSNLTKCILGGVLGFISSEFKYNIGDTMNCLTIINRDRRNDEKDIKRKYYKYKCNKCGNIDWIEESHLKRGCGCNACCNPPRKVVLGINTIWDKARWMVDLGVSEEDSKKYTPSSDEKIYIKCSDCGRIKKVAPSTIYQTHSIGCSCGDGISYPEKLMESILIQLDVKYERQYKTNWSQNKIYDFYLIDYNTIIETHGSQHYKEYKSFTRKTLEEEQENDKLKEELAFKNRVKYYIVINCSKSELEYIKNNILDSELNELLDLNKVDWGKCEKYALKNKVKKVCDYYKQHPGISTGDLVKEFNMDKKTIIKYLKSGTKLGWCKYNVKEERERHYKSISKPVSQYFEGEFIKTYTSAREAERQTGVNHGNISACCNGKQKTAGGYTWKYL